MKLQADNFIKGALHRKAVFISRSTNKRALLLCLLAFLMNSCFSEILCIAGKKEQCQISSEQTTKALNRNFLIIQLTSYAPLRCTTFTQLSLGVTYGPYKIEEMPNDACVTIELLSSPSSATMQVTTTGTKKAAIQFSTGGATKDPLVDDPNRTLNGKGIYKFYIEAEPQTELSILVN